MALTLYTALTRTITDATMSTPLSSTDVGASVRLQVPTAAYRGFIESVISATSFVFQSTFGFPPADAYLTNIIVDNGASVLVTNFRVDKIVQKILRGLGDEGQHSITREVILNEMDAVQLELCRDYYAIKGTAVLSLVNGTISYSMPANTYKIKEFIEPAMWGNHRIEVINNSAVFAARSRRIVACTHPSLAYFWNGQMMFYPGPTVAEALTVLVYLLPSVELADGANPETPPEYDDCLEWETLSRFNGDEKLHRRYVEKALKNGVENSKEAVAGILRVESSTDLLGY